VSSVCLAVTGPTYRLACRLVRVLYLKVSLSQCPALWPCHLLAQRVMMMMMMTALAAAFSRQGKRVHVCFNTCMGEPHHVSCSIADLLTSLAAVEMPSPMMPGPATPLDPACSIQKQTSMSAVQKKSRNMQCTMPCPPGQHRPSTKVLHC